VGLGTKELHSSSIWLLMTLGLQGSGVVEPMSTIDLLTCDDRLSVSISEPKLA
jgi:hypothetical protein